MRMSTILQVCIVGLMYFLYPVIASNPTTARNLEDSPQCSIDCLNDLMDPPILSTENRNHLCNDKKFNKIVAHCVRRNCSVRHSLDFFLIKQITCGDPEVDNTVEIRAIVFASFGIAVVSVTTRIVNKVNRFTKWGADDYLVIVSLVFITLISIMTHFMTVVGLGRNIWTYSDIEITRFYIYILIVEFGYVLSLCLVKLSILYFFLRTFPDPGFRTIVKWTIGFTILVSVVFAICGACQRQPIWLQWEGWKDYPPRGVTLDLQAMVLSHAGINVALDVWMFALPLTQLINLGLKLRKKTGVIVIFSVGIFLIAASCIRIPYLLTFSGSLNATVDSQGVVVWSCIEVCVGTMVACMPHTQPLFRAAMARARSMHILSSGSSSTEGIFIDRSLATIKTNFGTGGAGIGDRERVEPILQDRGGLLTSIEPLPSRQESWDKAGFADRAERTV